MRRVCDEKLFSARAHVNALRTARARGPNQGTGTLSKQELELVVPPVLWSWPLQVRSPYDLQSLNNDNTEP